MILLKASCRQHLSRAIAVVGLVCLVGLASCQQTAGDQPGAVKPTYNPETGRLEALTADRNGDGRADVRAEMDGLQFKRIEIDRDGNGQPDRWEYYGTAGVNASPSAGATAAPPSSLLVRAEEANGPDGHRVTRREFYTQGVISRIENDSDGDGRMDSWDWFDKGALVRTELDLQGRGRADRRLIYGASGNVDRVEVDTKGDGIFVPVAKEALTAPGMSGAAGGGQ